MSFTGQLGTSASQYANIEFGAGPGTGGGGGTIANESITIDGISTITLSVYGVTNNSISIDGVSAISRSGGYILAQTLSIDAVAATTELPGFLYQQTLTINGISSIDENLTTLLTISIDSISTITPSNYVAFNLTQNINSVTAITLALIHNIFTTQSIDGIAAINSPGGLVHDIQRSIDGIATVILLPGVGYFDTFSIDGVSATTETYIYIKNDSISIDGVAAIDESYTFITRPTLTVAGIAALTIAQNWDAVNSIEINGISIIYVENIYDYLYAAVCVAACTFSNTLDKPTTESVGCVGSFAVSSTAVLNRTATNTLVIFQNAQAKNADRRTAQSFVIGQSAVVHKLHTETITQTLSLTDVGDWSRLTNDTLSIGQTVTVIRVKSRTVTQSLNIGQEVARTATISRSLSDTLVFNVTNLQKAPIIGSQNQAGNRQFEYYVPTVNAVLIPRKCLIILGCPSQTILLPCPIFGDTQSLQATVNLKRSMTGLTYTYVKNGGTEKLKYSFELWTDKYIELRSYLLNHSEEVMTLINWKAETWLVNITNNPSEFTNDMRYQPKGERYTVTLEFEGIRIG